MILSIMSPKIININIFNITFHMTTLFSSDLLYLVNIILLNYFANYFDV